MGHITIICLCMFGCMEKINITKWKLNPFPLCPLDKTIVNSCSSLCQSYQMQIFPAHRQRIPAILSKPKNRSISPAHNIAQGSPLQGNCSLRKLQLFYRLSADDLNISSSAQWTSQLCCPSESPFCLKIELTSRVLARTCLVSPNWPAIQSPRISHLISLLHLD